VAALAFAFGLGLASALDFTPISIASNSRPAPKLTIGSPFGLDAADPSAGFADVVEMIAPTVVTIYVEQMSSSRIPRSRTERTDPTSDREAAPGSSSARTDTSSPTTTSSKAPAGWTSN
jgi:hypothetical protein